VSQEEAKNFAEANDLLYLEVSAKTSENVDKVGLFFGIYYLLLLGDSDIHFII
jgi:hypothetical protein